MREDAVELAKDIYAFFYATEKTDIELNYYECRFLLLKYS